MTDEKPRAVLDVGSNTVRLLVATIRNGTIEPILDRSEFVRLGLGVDKTGRLADDRMQAAIEAIRTLVGEARAQGADGVRAIATSAVRDASNGKAFAERVWQETGVELEIISGDREAHLTYLGTTIGVELDGGAIVCDLGGGSAELIFANDSGVSWSVSRPLGSGRLTERFIHHDPPTTSEEEELARYVCSVLDELPRAEPKLAVFTGGTATHVAILAGRHGSIETVDPATLQRVIDILNAAPASEIATRYDIREQRAQVLPAGVKTLQTVAGYYGVERIVITRNGIREGMLVDWSEQER